MSTREKSKDSNEKKDFATSYNQFKEFEGKQYTGMKVGRSHSWIYDAGPWKETKISPDKWEINYTVTKRRKGHAPEGSGVPVGTKYHWYILAHQVVEKLNANDYSTELTGLKYKIAHQRANKETWNISTLAQKKRLVKILKELVETLEKEIAATKKKPNATKPKPSANIKHFPEERIAKNDVSLSEEKKSRKRAHR